ncbi:MAG: hypothetical protein LC792_15370 [Actinobacteria bacterium]|nr:hypothetical protein [Actinomycetota bacterium]
MAAPNPHPLPVEHLYTDPTQQSGIDIIDQALQEFGLGQLATWATQQIINGQSPTEILLSLYDPKTEGGKVVDQLYPEIAMVRKDPALQPISIAQAVAYHAGAIDQMRAAHLPPGFYDNPEEIASLHAGGVSLGELQDRIVNGIQEAQKAPPEVLAAYGNYFGANGIGALASQFLDPTVSDQVLHQHLAAAQVGGAASRYNYALGVDQAQRIANYGVDYTQATHGFEQLGQEQQLFNPLAGESPSLTAAGAGIEANLLGNTEAERQIQRRQQQRSAAFAGSGDLLTTSQGVIGLGEAPQPR